MEPYWGERLVLLCGDEVQPTTTTLFMQVVDAKVMGVSLGSVSWRTDGGCGSEYCIFPLVARLESDGP
jgi:hypothetical protein